MRELILVARQTFLVAIKDRNFWFTMLGVPLITIVLMVVVAVVSSLSEESGDVAGDVAGYVDPANVLADAPEMPENYIEYETEAAGREALDAEEIGVLYVIPESYLMNGQITIYAYGTVPENVLDEFEETIASSLAERIGEGVPRERLVEPVEPEYFFTNSGRTVSGMGGFMGLILVPGILAFLFMFSLQIASTALMSSVVEEKSNRIMEVLITSLSPFQMLSGKMLGVGLIGLLQIAVWLVAGLIVFFVVNNQSDVLSGVSVQADMVIFAVIYYLLTYFLFASVSAGIGALIDGEQEARQYAGIISMFAVIPFIAFFTFLENPNGTVPVVLSIVPFTSAIAMLLRMALTAVPPFELLLSVGLLLLTTIGVLWASAKVFRWALLLYGKTPGPRAIFKVIRGDVEIGTVIATGEEK